MKGNGSRKIAVFSDPDCPFCKRVEQEFEKMNDVTVYILLYPIEQLPGSRSLRDRRAPR
ncbi:thioredoxin fold domain-containing protein [Mycobacterium tuberculosis]|uniref:thioredoxin fold domain-containing protein n=1 Tax=Mycobacterium tuberculosis TaxID=1773 RepID=UPI00272C8398|nr:thioredoxin fold domain-containing protein [Mycobacterium tuberculosis]